jgi:hypothetical protein
MQDILPSNLLKKPLGSCSFGHTAPPRIPKQALRGVFLLGPQIMSTEFTKTVRGASLLERIFIRSMVVLLKIEGNCSCLRAKVAHMVGHLPIGKLHTTACILHKKLGIFAVREALRARYSEKWELENPLVNLEFDSFQLSGECVTIRA